jgi:hypothetical protein
MVIVFTRNETETKRNETSRNETKRKQKSQLVPLISIPCIVKMFVCIAPVTQLAAAECIFE